MEQQRAAEIEKKVDTLLSQTDALLTAAEQARSFPEVWSLCREAVNNLLTAFLLVKEGKEVVTIDHTVERLWELCAEQEEEFQQIAANIRILDEYSLPTSEESIESVLDAANEVWDFVLGSLSEE